MNALLKPNMYHTFSFKRKRLCIPLGKPTDIGNNQSDVGCVFQDMQWRGTKGSIAEQHFGATNQCVSGLLQTSPTASGGATAKNADAERDFGLQYGLQILLRNDF